MSKPLIIQSASPPDSRGVFGPGAEALRVGLYARVSTHDQKTLPLQLSAMRDYAKKRNWTIAIEVQDVASGATIRPQRETLIEAADEPVAGYPKRPVPRNEDVAKAIKKRTLTNLYNDRPQWLADAHEALDAAVPAAYGWSADISDDDALRELLALNAHR